MTKGRQPPSHYSNRNSYNNSNRNSYNNSNRNSYTNSYNNSYSTSYKNRPNRSNITKKGNKSFFKKKPYLGKFCKNCHKTNHDTSECYFLFPEKRPNSKNGLNTNIYYNSH